MTADIVASYVLNNSVRPADLPALLTEVHAAVAGLNRPTAPVEPALDKPTPSQIRKSITPDALISFIDGKSYKTLKRHLTGHGLDARAYCERFGLPADYPMTAASYAAMRSEFARSNRLGQNRQKAAAKIASVAETVSEAPKARGRTKAAEPAAAPAEKPARARKPKKATAAE